MDTKNVTTPLWFAWSKKSLVKELETAVQTNDALNVGKLISYGVNPHEVRSSSSDNSYFRDRLLVPA